MDSKRGMMTANQQQQQHHYIRVEPKIYARAGTNKKNNPRKKEKKEREDDRVTNLLFSIARVVVSPADASAAADRQIKSAKHDPSIIERMVNIELDFGS